jgi:ubiquinone/menaquinone biosynthesis C-methylase UbiE
MRCLKVDEMKHKIESNNKPHIHDLHFHNMHGGGHIIDKELEKVLSNALEGASTLAELGCGFGFYCSLLAKYAEKLYCVDINKVAIEEAKTNLNVQNVVFLNEDAAHTSIPSSSINAVLFANSFHDMDKEQVYEEVKRIVKPNGKVIIIDWDKNETEFGPPLNIRLSKEDYLRIFKDFKLEDEFIPGTYHYGLILRRA